MSANKTATAVGWCEVHRKLLYTDRKRARRIARKHTTHKSTYPCNVSDGMWHVGGLPVEVLTGEMTRYEFYQQKRAS